jgi:hypothetical protein
LGGGGRWGEWEVPPPLPKNPNIQPSQPKTPPTYPYYPFCPHIEAKYAQFGNKNITQFNLAHPSPPFSLRDNNHTPEVNARGVKRERILIPHRREEIMCILKATGGI